MTGYIDNVIASQAAHGRPADCPVMLWLEDQRGRPDDDVRADLVQRPEWEGWHSLEGIFWVRDYAPDERAKIQCLYANHIASKPKDSSWRSMVAKSVIKLADKLDPDARATLAAWLG